MGVGSSHQHGGACGICQASVLPFLGSASCLRRPHFLCGLSSHCRSKGTILQHSTHTALLVTFYFGIILHLQRNYKSRTEFCFPDVDIHKPWPGCQNHCTQAG